MSTNYDMYNLKNKSPKKILDSVKKHIKYIDDLIYNYGEVSSSAVKVYRGITGNIDNHYGLNLSYLSTSTDYDVALGFAGKTCCIFEYLISPGIPFLSLKSASNNDFENEILLPRGLTVTLIDEKISGKNKIYVCFIEMTTKNQFKTFKCRNHNVLIHI